MSNIKEPTIPIADRKMRNQQHPKTTGRNRQSEGFTLIEVLLAMAILAVVVTVIYAVFSTSSANAKRAEAVRDETDLARTLMSRMSDDIANAYCSTGLSGTFFYGKHEEVETEGDTFRHDSLSLTTLTNWRKPDSNETDLWEVGYSFEEKSDGSGYVLVRREKRELSSDAPPLEGGVEYEISDRVAELRVRYYDGTNWSDAWDRRTGCSPSNLPLAVEISLTLDSGSVFVTQVLHEKLAGS
jgi:general secretion pathway protein J